MNEKMGLSNEILIEIVHSIKDIIVSLIDRAFPRERYEHYEKEEIHNQ